MTATVSSPNQMKQALRDGVQHLVIRTMEFHSPADCINVADYVGRGNNGIIMEGSGGTYANSSILRLFDDGPPLIHFDNSRDWEVRLRGLIFDGQWHSGSMLTSDETAPNRMNQSLFADLKFNYCGSDANDSGAPPFDLAAPSCNFDFIQLLHNRNACVIRHGTNVEWHSGLIQSNWKASGIERSGGLRIKAPAPGANVVPEVARLSGIHNEGCSVEVEGYRRGVLYEGGYHLGATVTFTDCGEVHHDMRAGSWVDSRMTHNGRAINPMPRRKLFGLF